LQRAVLEKFKEYQSTKTIKNLQPRTLFLNLPPMVLLLTNPKEQNLHHKLIMITDILVQTVLVKGVNKLDVLHQSNVLKYWSFNLTKIALRKCKLFKGHVHVPEA
jgi:hypothetical protein